MLKTTTKELEGFQLKINKSPDHDYHESFEILDFNTAINLVKVALENGERNVNVDTVYEGEIENPQYLKTPDVVK